MTAWASKRNRKLRLGAHHTAGGAKWDLCYCTVTLRSRPCRHGPGELRCKRGSDFGVGGCVEVDTVPLIEVGRKFLRIIDDDADASCTKVIRYRRNIGGATFLGSKEAEICCAHYTSQR